MTRPLHFLLLFLLLPSFHISAQDFVLVDATTKVQLVYDPAEAKLDSISANLLAQDIELVSGYRPVVLTDISKASGNVILVGRAGSRMVQQVQGKQASAVNNLQGKWETYALKVMKQPLPNIRNLLVVAGSDRRGTAFGVFHLSEKIGVSPWYWWADVKPVQQKELKLSGVDFVSAPPSVKYRGIFLNDEDWGLQPWAAQNIDTDIKDIGPKTYAKIFELLLRLKANLIWPAMHPSTKAFFHYPQNPKVADAYGILVGTSHAEPMLRNNVDEWNEKTMGSFDYFSNKKTVHDYWEKRAAEAGNLEAIYTLGMRGVHDSGMKGASNRTEAAKMLEQIIADQRSMLQKRVSKNVAAVPQAFTTYKEVLEIYDQGMQLPEDITIVWPDDNYGYIHRLSNEQEQQRPGGSGVYYHASYWGRPHDYLWLGSTHPALIREEMAKAYEMKSRELWVLNVGDIKPLEYNIQLFLDMAYRADPFVQDSRYVKQHQQAWLTGIFGKEKGAQLNEVMWQYYQLAFERKPEFMGWSQTEPTTQTNYTTYNHFYYGDEAQRRLDKYEALEQQVKDLRQKISPEQADAFYQLVYYPVVGASLMNKKFLYRDKQKLYAQQHRASAPDYAQRARQAYEEIVNETSFYNNQLSSGKWRGMMSMKPRNLPVYLEPVLPELKVEAASGAWAVAPEGYVKADSSLVTKPGEPLRLPTFSPWGSQQYFLDVFLTGAQPVSWRATSSAKWITLSETKGELTSATGRNEKRLWIGIDRQKVPKKMAAKGHITVKGAGQTFTIAVETVAPAASALAAHKGFVEENGYVSIFAENYSRKTDEGPASWTLVEGLGRTGNSLLALPLQPAPEKETEQVQETAASVEYDFFLLKDAAAPVVTVATLPTHPLTNHYSLRYAVSVDDGPLQVVDFKTFGRSEEWKQNVLSNRATRTVKLPALKAGKHVLKIYMIDPAVLLDQITIDLGGLKPAYGTIPETKK
ncbi:glycosyl hydrolase 115 family protein [Pontibacter beigongshangensis]|uniref:glycosyl hydrolase 115 family protein n=1 Tax=Pontibacter beigongshangensis TaxID=2574733 RepID=UPI00164EE6A6|nr:glycosyl hydrolase 115 family protein [Pontibacter beigongshangensis]